MALTKKIAILLEIIISFSSTNWLWLIDEFIISSSSFVSAVVRRAATAAADAVCVRGKKEKISNELNRYLSASASTIYRKTHQIKIYVLAVVTHGRPTLAFLRPDSAPKEKNGKINSNGIWFTLQIFWCEKVCEKERKRQKIRRTKAKEEKKTFPFVRSFGRACHFIARSHISAHFVSGLALLWKPKYREPFDAQSHTHTQRVKNARKTFYIISLLCRL